MHGYAMAAAALASLMITACGGTGETVRAEQAGGTSDGKGFLVQQGHSAAVRVAAIAADGSRAASFDEDGVLCLWDGEGRLVARVAGPGGEGRLLAVSPRAEFVAAAWYDVLAFSQNVAVYRLADGALVWRRSLEAACGALAWNQAGTELAVTSGRKALRFGPGGKVLVETEVAALPEGGAVAAAFARDGRLGLAGSDGALCLVGTDGTAATRAGLAAGVTALAFETNGTLVAGYRHGFVRRIAANGSVLPDRYCGGPVEDFCVTADGSVRPVIVRGGMAGLADADGTIRIQRYLPRGTRGAAAVRIAADGRCLGGHPDGGLSFFRADGTLVPVLPEAPAITALAVSGQGQVVAGTAGGRLVFFDAGMKIGSFTAAHEGQVRALAWRPDGQALLSCGYEGRISLWTAAGIGYMTQIAHREAANAGAWSRDGALFATVGTWDKSIRVFRAGGQGMATMSGHFEAIMGVSFAADGRSLVSAANDSTIRVWNLADGRERTLARMSGIASLAHDGSGTRLLVAGHEGARILDAQSGAVLEKLGGEITAGAAWNGERVFFALVDGTVKSWPGRESWSAGGPAVTVAGGGTAFPVAVGLADGRVVFAGQAAGSRLTIQIFADGRSLVYDGAGRWDAGDEIAAGRFARLAHGAVRTPGLAAAFFGR